MLQQSKIFSFWEKNIYCLLPLFEYSKYAFGETIYKENDPSDQLYAIIKGEVEISQLSLMQK